MSKSKPPVSATVRRRKLVGGYVFDRGVTSPVEIMRILEAEEGIVVRRETVSNDYKCVLKDSGGGLGVEKVKEFHLDLLSVYRKRIGELDVMIVGMGDVMKRASLMRAQSQIMKDMGQVTRDLAEVSSGRWIGSEKDGKKKEESVSITFVDRE